MSSESFAKKLGSSQVRRIALSLQYDGSFYSGWQHQRNLSSVQGTLEEAICKFSLTRPIKAVAAGRTDAGVHAAGQVVHFDSLDPMPVASWAAVLNRCLPDSIRVIEAAKASSAWHACYSAIYRRYRYTIYNGCRPNLFLAPWSWHRYHCRLDEQKMQDALRGLLGLHDFSAFQRAGSNRANAFTTIQDVSLERHGDLLVLEIQATGFLYGMIRLLMGQLVAVGEHRLTLEDFERRWKELRRDEVREAAPARGLCFLRVGYRDLIFSEAISYDFMPRYFLSSGNSPVPPLDYFP